LLFSSPQHSKHSAEWLDAAVVVVDFTPEVWVAFALPAPPVDSEALLLADSEVHQLVVSEALP
jgi:hypothetical protein